MPTRQVSVRVPGQGMQEITREVEALVGEIIGELGAVEGLCTVFIPHTSASLTIQENADPSAKHDLERWLTRLVPEGDPEFTHTAEGPDDMPSHIRSAITSTSETIPIVDGAMALGTWQGIYLLEHRDVAHTRNLVVHVHGE